MRPLQKLSIHTRAVSTPYNVIGRSYAESRYDRIGIAERRLSVIWLQSGFHLQFEDWRHRVRKSGSPRAPSPSDLSDEMKEGPIA
jgi:hypothetical protein